MGFLFEDVRLGIRRLWQQPGFTAVAVVMLALGLGANTTMFTLVHELLLQRLPVERAERALPARRQQRLLREQRTAR